MEVIMRAKIRSDAESMAVESILDGLRDTPVRTLKVLRKTKSFGYESTFAYNIRKMSKTLTVNIDKFTDGISSMEINRMRAFAVETLNR